MIEETVDTTSQEPSAWCSVKGGQTSGTLLFVIQITGIVLLLGAVVVGYARWRTGSVAHVLPYLAGERLLIEPMHLDLGDVPKGEVIERELRVFNLGSQSLKLLGSQRSCGCVAMDEFPIVIPGGADCTLKLRIGMSNKSGPFAHTIKLFSDNPGRMSVIITVTGVVL